VYSVGELLQEFPPRGVVLSVLSSTRIFGLLLAAAIVVAPMVARGYMPPPDPCELAPLTYGPPAPPMCAGPPPPQYCGPCPPVHCYPTKVGCPPPGPIIVCKCPPVPTAAAYRVCPPPPCPPPPCRSQCCMPTLCVSPPLCGGYR
jgi:hypothetical protein